MALDPAKLQPFPNLLAGEYRKTSDESDEYNCIAWAAGDTTRWWWPRPQGRRDYWPKEAPNEVTVEAFVVAFRLQGYEPCDTGDLEDQYEKVAIYIGSHGKPTHAAIQRPNGIWSSKLGDWEDIEHKLNGVEGPDYGRAAVFLRRPLGA